jgi:hypothetical protein
MENPFSKNEKSARLKWKMRSLKWKNPNTITGKICSVKLKTRSEKWNFLSVKM